MEETLVTLLNRGGIHYNMPGNTVKDLMLNLIGAINFPPNLDRDVLLGAVLEREGLMSTGTGNGVALPHPRNPLVEKPEEQYISICFPGTEIDWKALDGKPVHSVILIVSASAKLHLHTLSRVSFLCRQEPFLGILRERAPEEVIIRAIKEAEANWN